MAHHKEGLDYFSLDADFFGDRKIKRLIKSNGAKAIGVWLALACSIYDERGYYVDWSEDLCFDIAETLGMSEVAVQETINSALVLGLYDQHMYDTYSILTSRSIQRRYIEATIRRKGVVLRTEYDLSGDYVDILKQDVGKTCGNIDSLQQSKVKESKRKNARAKSHAKKDCANPDCIEGWVELNGVAVPCPDCERGRKATELASSGSVRSER